MTRSGQPWPAIAGVTLGANDLALSGAFYDRLAAPLGLARLAGREREIAYGGTDGRALFRLLAPHDGLPATWGNGTHVAFLAPSRAAVDAFHSAGLGAGGLDEGAPGLRPLYGPNYYGAYLRDPVGNKLQAVHLTELPAAEVRRAGGLSHVTLGSNDVARARAFYDAVLAPLGLVRVADEGDGADQDGGDGKPQASAWCWPDGQACWLFVQRPFDGRPASWANGGQVDFRAADRAAVDAFHAAGLAAGAQDAGAPGARAYRPGYYGAYLRDPDGNKLHAFWLPDG